MRRPMIAMSSIVVHTLMTVVVGSSGFMVLMDAGRDSEKLSVWYNICEEIDGGM